MAEKCDTFPSKKKKQFRNDYSRLKADIFKSCTQILSIDPKKTENFPQQNCTKTQIGNVDLIQHEIK